MQTTNETPARPYAGFCLRTKRQMRFWGWSSHGWTKLHRTAAKVPVQNLATWLRQAHAQLDFPATGEELAPPTQTRDAQQQNRKFELVCNRRMIGLLIR